MPDEMDELDSIEDQLAAAEAEDSDTDSEDDIDSTDEVTNSSGAEEEKETTKPFSFDETDMVSFYVREETEQGWKSARKAAEAAVSKQTDADDVASSEFQDAALRVLSEQAAEVAMAVLEERDVDADEERVREIVDLMQN